MFTGLQARLDFHGPSGTAVFYGPSGMAGFRLRGSPSPEPPPPRVSDLVERNEPVAVEVVQIEGGADLVIATATAEDRQPARKLGEIHDAIA